MILRIPLFTIQHKLNTRIAALKAEMEMFARMTPTEIAIFDPFLGFGVIALMLGIVVRALPVVAAMWVIHFLLPQRTHRRPLREITRRLRRKTRMKSHASSRH